MSDFDAMNIKWFPGHMTKTRRYIEKNIGRYCGGDGGRPLYTRFAEPGL